MPTIHPRTIRPNRRTRRRARRAPELKMLAATTIGLYACADSATDSGHVQVFVEPEESIIDGLEAGDGEEQIADGWEVTYDRFVTVIGPVWAGRDRKDTQELRSEDAYVVDLQAVPAGGFVIAEFEDVEATRFSRFGFDMPVATEDALRAEGTSEADYEEMVDNGYSLLVSGRITKSDGTSCSPTVPTDCVDVNEVRFEFKLAAGTRFDDCAAENGDSGFAVPSAGTVQVKPTIHGDHWFFSELTQGAERTERRAQWLADADLDRNGKTTGQELSQVRASDLFTPEHYNLSGALTPIETALDYVVAQAHTLGDFQGSGECPTRSVSP